MSAVIRNIQIENVKRIKAVKITPKDSTVIVSGKNDQGKSSTLDSIDYVFCERAVCEQPLRAGEKRGRVFLQLSEELGQVFTVEKIFRPSGNELIVRNADNVPQKTPQALLDAIYSRVMFDPLSFVRMRSMDQVETLRKLVGLDFTQLNSDRQRAYDDRTVKNRELLSAQTKLSAFPFDPTAPKEFLSTSALAEKLGTYQAGNQIVEAKRKELAALSSKHKSLESDVSRLKSDIDNIKKMLEAKASALMEKEDALATTVIDREKASIALSAVNTTDEASVRSQIKYIEEINSVIAANARHNEAQKEVDALQVSVASLTKAIQEFDAEKKAQIEFAEFPMEGLSFDEEKGVLLNGVPFAQGSSACQLKAAIAIGLALNPQVRVILIRDGSLLDDESLKMVSEMASKSNAQVWIEVVKSTDPAAIVIEDGEVKL